MNVCIHLVCIWNLVWSFFLLLHLLGALAPAPSLLSSLPLLAGVPLSLGTLATLVYVISYTLMDPVAGGLGALLMLALNQWTAGLAAVNRWGWALHTHETSDTLEMSDSSDKYNISDTSDTSAYIRHI